MDTNALIANIPRDFMDSLTLEHRKTIEHAASELAAYARRSLTGTTSRFEDAAAKTILDNIQTRIGIAARNTVLNALGKALDVARGVLMSRLGAGV